MGAWVERGCCCCCGRGCGQCCGASKRGCVQGGALQIDFLRKASLFPVTFVVDFHRVVMVVVRWEVNLIWYVKVTKLRAPESSPSHCFEWRHGSRGGCLASEDSQVSLVLLCRVKDVMHPPSGSCAAAGTRKGSWSSSGGSSQGPLLSPRTFLAFSIWERTTGGKSGLILRCRCYATTQDS